MRTTEKPNDLFGERLAESLAALLEVSVVVDVGLLLLGRHAVVGVVHHVVGQRAPHGLLTDGGAVREGFADEFALSEGAG